MSKERVELKCRMADPERNAFDIRAIYERAQTLGLNTIAMIDEDIGEKYAEIRALQREYTVRAIAGAEVTLIFEDETMTNCTLLIKDVTGLDNLEKLFAEARRHNDIGVQLKKEELSSMRGGLLVGADCTGEILEAIMMGQSDETIERMMRFYDYIEVQPLHILGEMCDYIDLSENDLKRIVSIAKKAGKPVAAVSNAWFIDEDIAQEEYAFWGHLESGNEIGRDFSDVFSCETIRRIVYTDPVSIAEMCIPLTDIT